MTFSALWLKLVALFPEKGMAVCVAVIGKENSPLYIRWYCFDIDLLLVMEKPPLRSWISFANLVLSSCADPAQELTFHYSLHTSLDVIEEKLSASNKAAGSDQRELYLGALNSSEHQKVFGYVTNTRIKFVIIVDSSNTSLRDNETRQMFRLVYFIFGTISWRRKETEFWCKLYWLQISGGFIWRSPMLWQIPSTSLASRLPQRNLMLLCVAC